MAQKSWSHYERFVILYVCIYCKSMAALDSNVWPWFSSFSLNRVMIRVVVSGGVEIGHRSCVKSNSDRYPANCRGASKRPYMIWKCYGQAGGIPLFIHIHHVSCRIQWIVLLFSLVRVFMAGERAPRWGRDSIFVIYLHILVVEPPMASRSYGKSMGRLSNSLHIQTTVSDTNAWPWSWFWLDMVVLVREKVGIFSWASNPV